MIPLKVKVKVVKTHPEAKTPKYQTEGSAGCDLHAIVLDDAGQPSSHRIHPGQAAAFSTGLIFEIPIGWEGQIRPRSGLAINHGVTVVNSPGTADADFRGIIKVALINHGGVPYDVQHGERIAQLVLAPAYQALFEEVETLSFTARGSGGFGSTGK